MKNPLDDYALDVASSMISEYDEENHQQHTDSNQVQSWTPFSPDSHLSQPTLIPPDEESEVFLQDQREEDDLEAEAEGANTNNKDTPISVYFEEPPDDFALPTANQLAEPPSQSEAADAALLLRYHYRYGNISFRHFL